MIDWRKLPWSPDRRKTDERPRHPASASRAQGRETAPEIVRNFTPNWFTVTMGTGALALTLNQFPLAIPGLRAVAVGLWLANIALFALFSLLYAARWVLFPARGGADFQTSGDVDVFRRDPDGACDHRQWLSRLWP